jgi:hypothetical protein
MRKRIFGMATAAIVLLSIPAASANIRHSSNSWALSKCSNGEVLVFDPEVETAKEACKDQGYSGGVRVSPRSVSSTTSTTQAKLKLSLYQCDHYASATQAEVKFKAIAPKGTPYRVACGSPMVYSKAQLASQDGNFAYWCADTDTGKFERYRVFTRIPYKDACGPKLGRH